MTEWTVEFEEPDLEVHLSGALLKSRYRVVSLLGKGGFGLTYLAMDERSFGSKVVIRLPAADLLAKDRFADLFALETRGLVELDLPHLVRVLDTGEFRGCRSRSSSTVSGGSLLQRFAAGEGGLQPAEVVQWLPTVAAALDFLHERGFVHRDVKPENILFDHSGRPLLSDLAVAKSLRAHETRTGKIEALCGSPAYMPPESVTLAPPSPAYDQYSLAVVLYQTLCGRLPFDWDAPLPLLTAKSRQTPRNLLTFAPQLPSPATRTVMQALSTDPAQRFPSCTDLARAFIHGLGHQRFVPVVMQTRGAEPPAAPEAIVVSSTRDARPADPRRAPGWALAAGGALAALLIGVPLTLALRGAWVPGTLEDSRLAPTSPPAAVTAEHVQGSQTSGRAESAVLSRPRLRGAAYDVESSAPGAPRPLAESAVTAPVAPGALAQSKTSAHIASRRDSAALADSAEPPAGGRDAEALLPRSNAKTSTAGASPWRNGSAAPAGSLRTNAAADLESAAPAEADASRGDAVAAPSEDAIPPTNDDVTPADEAGASSAAEAPAGRREWRPLLQGDLLAGWRTVGQIGWTFRDSVLHLSPATVLVTEGSHRDLALTVRALTYDAGAVFGMIVRAQNGGRGIKLEFRGGDGTLRIGDTTLSIPVELTAGHWHQLDLIVRDQIVLAYVDRRKAASARDPDVSSGPIGLYCKSGRVELRAMFVQSLE